MITLKFLGQPGIPGEVTDDEWKIIEQMTSQETSDNVGIVRDWKNIVNNSTYYFCIVHEEYGIVGLTGWSGMPSRVAPVWWLACEYRGKKIGKRLIPVLASKMKQYGVTGIGEVPIDIIPTGNNEIDRKLYNASRQMVIDLKKCFQA